VTESVKPAPAPAAAAVEAAEPGIKENAAEASPRRWDAADPELAMRESMAHVEKEMGELGRARPGLREGPVVVPGELDKVVIFKWNGSLDGAVKKLAAEVGYTVLIDAPWNAPGVHVGISTGPRRVYDIFEALGAAAGNQATVEVDPQHHRVEVIYHV
jgi:defect in organelle trafficking protein DotD